MSSMCSNVNDVNNKENPCRPKSVTSRAARRNRTAKRRTNIASLDMLKRKRRIMIEKLVETKYARKKCNFCDKKEAPHGCLAYNSSYYSAIMMHGGAAQSSSCHVDPDPMYVPSNYPKYGVISVCGRRRDMEDAVAIQPNLAVKGQSSSSKIQFYAVYDGHGCAHVSLKCSQRLHEIVKEEIETSSKWKQAMVNSFSRMDEEIASFNKSAAGALCRCDRNENDDSAGSTAIVAIVTPEKIIVANVGDSRAVLCRNGQAIPLSNDHKPDRPDELERIKAAGGQVFYWDGARVMGVLAMSRAIGDNYLKPFVSCEPEVTIINREPEDDCLILGSDGLWDLVSNATACGVAKMCMQDFNKPENPAIPLIPFKDEYMATDKGCCDAATLLTKLALARNSEDNVSVLVVDLKKKSQ